MIHRHWGLWAVVAATVVPAWIGCAAGVRTQGGGADGGSGGEPETGGGGAGGVMTTSSSSSGVPIGAPCDGPGDCNALNSQCVVGACVNGGCQQTPANEFGACDDGQYCTENDICQEGQCVGGALRFCPSQDSCHLGACDEALKTCKNLPGNDGAQCEDNDVCTTAGKCMNGACAKGSPVNCSVFDGECSVGVCDPVVGCKPLPKNDGVACNDGKGSICSVGVCSQGMCTSIAVNDGLACDNGQNNPCIVGKCTQGLCGPVPANDGASCDDGLFCTIGDHCVNGLCAMGAPNPCAPPGGCWVASCDEFADLCTAVPGNDGTPCDDGSNCTDGSTCSNGACLGGAPVNDGAACDDGSMCTSGETCAAGLCTGGSGITIYFQEDFSDNNAGWTLGPEWQIGFATASQNGVYGADPAVDHSPTGDNGVAGVVIGGNASTNLHPYYYLESPAFNTAVAAGPVILGFYRWLNSDYDPYMHNDVEVFNGNSWVKIWETGPSPGIQDSPPAGLGWTFIQHDLTQYKNAQMRIRFGFDINAGGVFTIGSWNLDDVLVAEQACP